MEKCSVRTVKDEQGAVEYTLERKSVKNINLRIQKDGTVTASANYRTSVLRIDGFVQSKLPFIRKAQQKLAQRAARNPGPRTYTTGETYRIGGKEYTLLVKTGSPQQVSQQGNTLVMQLQDPDNTQKRSRLFALWWEEQCRVVFGEIMSRVQPCFAQWGVEMPTLKLRDMTSRWGSCIPLKKTITLNKRLLSAPMPCIEYVVLHEFCHFIHPDHSKQFWALVATFMPDWKQRRKLLEQTAEF